MTTFDNPKNTDPFGIPNVLRRDRFGRPIIPAPGAEPGGDGEPYRRCTTFIKALDDTTSLATWKQRMTALGVVKDPSLIKALKAATYEDKATLDEVCEKAMTLAGAGSKATLGTALHKLTEYVDRGEELPEYVDDADRADIAAYQRAMAGLRIVDIETFVVHDELKVAGTFDRMVEAPNGQRYIADLKTGRVDKSTFGSQAMQLAVYANSLRYDAQTNGRSALDVDLRHAVIVHVPAGSGTARLVWLDIAAAWYGVQQADAVWKWRAYASRVLDRKTGATALVSHIEAAV